MAAANLTSFNPPAGWVDLVIQTGLTGLASTACVIQCVSPTPVEFFIGGAAAPAAGVYGHFLSQFDTWPISSDHIWVRSAGGTLAISLS